MLIYNNTITQEDRGVDANGFGIKALYNYNKGVKIYNNDVSVPPWDESSWDFAIEMLESRGGIEIYDNTIIGVLDISSVLGVGGIAANDAGGYGFALKIHDNTIGQTTLQTHREKGIDVEHILTGGVHIYHNWIKNVVEGIYFTASAAMNGVYVYYNIITGIGVSGVGGSGNGIRFADTAACSNFVIFNNVIYGEPACDTLVGISKPYAGTLNDITIRNNIIEYFDEHPIYFDACTVNTCSIENNCFYNCGGGNDAEYAGATMNSLTEQNNLEGTDDPAFVTPGSDFHLQAGSACINAGIVVWSITTLYDYDDVEVSPLIEIGAYQY